MENASKALIIAGGVLIAVMIVSIAVYLFQSSGSLSQSYEDKLKQDAITAYNNKFLQYGKNMNGQDMVSLINLIAETNENQDRKVHLYISGIEVNNIKEISNSQKTLVDLMTKTSTDSTSAPMYVFISYNFYDDGYIKEIRYTGPKIEIKK